MPHRRQIPRLPLFPLRLDRRRTVLDPVQGPAGLSHRRQILWLPLFLLLLAACQNAPEAYADVPRITPEEVVALREAGNPVVIVDTRSARQFGKRRIPGALSIPARETEDHLDRLPLWATIAFY